MIDAAIDLDSNAVAGAIQALATVVAVVIGYGLSVLSERKTRRVMEDAAERERRLEAIVGLVDLLDEARGGVDVVGKALAPFAAAVAAEASQTAAAKRVAGLTAAVQSVGATADELELTERRLGRQAIAMRVLGFENSVVRDVDAARQLVKEALLISRDPAPDTGASCSRLAEVEISLGESIERLIDIGRRIN